MDAYFESNRKLWNAWVDPHLQAPLYDMEGFRGGASSLKGIERSLLGSVRDKDLLHLQCHFGQDSLSLARMGARVTGIDFSDRAIQRARELAGELEIPARFICGNVLETELLLDERFDLIYTSYGVLGWLPDLAPWAQVVASRLRPAGEFLLVEFHPVLHMLDEGMQYLKYPYFKQPAEPETTTGSYADPTAGVEMEEYFWNHSLAEVLQSLLDAGLEITHFSEYDFSPWDCFQRTVAHPSGFQIEGLEGKLPMVFALKARLRKGSGP